MRKARRDVKARKLKSVGNVDDYTEVLSATLKKGDIVYVKAGEQIPMDGEVIDGAGSLKHLALLIKNAGKDLTHDYIMREIWGLYADDSHTLRVNMANIRRKIESNPGAPQYILTEMGVGYRMVEEL